MVPQDHHGLIAAGGKATDLQTLAQEGYERFRAPTPRSLAVCTFCCMKPEVERRILSRMPRDIPLDEIQEWYGAAFGADDSADAVRWLLPRILELLAAGNLLRRGGNEVVFDRIALSGYPNGWSDAEAAFLERFCATLAAAVVMKPESLPELESLDECLCMIALGGIAMSPVLAALDQCPVSAVARALAPDGFPAYLGWNNYWPSGPSCDAAMAWYTSDAMLDRMIALGDDESVADDDRACAWIVADDILSRR